MPLPKDALQQLLEYLSQHYLDGEFHLIETLFGNDRSYRTHKGYQQLIDEVKTQGWIKMNRPWGMQGITIGEHGKPSRSWKSPYTPLKAQLTLKGHQYYQQYYVQQEEKTSSNLPIIFLAFANEAPKDECYLRKLREEHAQLRGIWERAEEKGLCELIERYNATSEEIKDVFIKHGNRIEVFHFGGHASSQGLLLNYGNKQTSKKSHASGLLPFIADRSQMRLAFFNGCSSSELAAYLSKHAQFNAIGTSQSVNDEVALQLAVKFHNSLANSHSVEQSFRDMQNSLIDEYGSNNFRDLVWEDHKPPKSHNELWQLYPQAPDAPQRLWELGMEDLPKPKTTYPRSMAKMKYSLEDIKAWDSSQCLRPTFTQLLLKELLINQRSLNLTGAKGQGKRRMLEDLKKLCQDHGIVTALLDLNQCRRRYGFFLKEMARGLQLPHTHHQSFDELLDDLTASPHRLFLIMIDNLEVLNEPKKNDTLYNADFISSLNFIKNRDNCLLLCSSVEWLKQVEFENETSLLSLGQMKIPQLRGLDIQREIERELAGQAIAENAQHLYELGQAVEQNKLSCESFSNLLNQCKAHYQSKTFNKDLQNWLKAWTK